MFFGNMNGGCGCGGHGNVDKGNDCCWLILILLLCGNCNFGGIGGDDNCCCTIILLLLLLNSCGCSKHI